MTIPIYRINTFTEHPFTGNAAAVIPLNEWLSNEVMSNIANENNLSHTAFYIPSEKGFHIRWFTPAYGEVGVCGQATLAAAYVIFKLQAYKYSQVLFETSDGLMIASFKDDWITLSFSASSYSTSIAPPALLESIKANLIVEIYKGSFDYMIVLDSEQQLALLDIDLLLLSTIPARGIIMTAPGNEVDFVSRFFSPQSGLDEDPVNTSTHTMLVPYWAGKLSKSRLTAKQLSKRGGYLRCELLADTVSLSGQARLYLRAQINIC